MNTPSAPNELIEELDAGMGETREIVNGSYDMYAVYRTLREFPEGLQSTTSRPECIQGEGNGS